MEYNSISEIAAQGMGFERSRIEAASMKISAANVAFGSEENATEFLSSLSAKASTSASISLNNTQIKAIQDADHPMANAEGMVYFVNVDPTVEMATLVSATRAYEANIRAYNTNSQMVTNALSIGGGNR